MELEHYARAVEDNYQQLADILLDVPSTSTPLIQQVHICLYHYLCAEIEERIAAQG